MPRKSKRTQPEDGFEDSLDNSILNNNHKRRRLTIKQSRKRNRHNTNNNYESESETDSDFRQPPRKRRRLSSSYSSESDAFDYHESDNYEPDNETESEDEPISSDDYSSSNESNSDSNQDIDLFHHCKACSQGLGNQEAHNYPGGCCYSGESDSIHDQSDLTSNDDLYSDDVTEDEVTTEDEDSDNNQNVNWSLCPTPILKLINDRFIANQGIESTIDHHEQIKRAIVSYPYNSYQRKAYVNSPGHTFFLASYQQNGPSLNKLSDVIKRNPSSILCNIIKIRDNSRSVPSDWTCYRQHYCNECGDHCVLDSFGHSDCCMSCRTMTEVNYSYTHGLDYINAPRR